MKNIKNLFKVFVCLCIAIGLFLPQKQSHVNAFTGEVGTVGADFSTYITNDNDESNVYEEPSNQLDYNYLIPDLELRKLINSTGWIGKADEAETYSVTKEELASIPSLGLRADVGNVITFQSLEGLQYLENATYLRVLRASIPEDGLEYIAQMSSLETLTFNAMFFSGDDGTLKKYNVSINGGEVHNEIYMPFDQHVDLSPLAKLPKLDYLYVGVTGMQQQMSTYSNRAHYDLSGLGDISTLEELHLNHIGSVDDPSFGFIEKLTNLKKIQLVNTPINDVNSIASLPNLETLYLDYGYVTDFSPIIDKEYFTGSQGMKINSPTSFYDTKDIDGISKNVISLDTGINVGEGIEEISFTTDFLHASAFKIDSYSYDGKLNMELILNKSKTYYTYNWVNGEYDIPHLGFVWGVDITTENGKSISYSTNTITVGKKVTFDANYEGGGSVEVLLDPYELIEEPTILPMTRNQLNFGRSDHEITGWSTDPEGTDMFDFNTEQHTNITLYAQWKALDTTVEPDPDPIVPDGGGNTPDPDIETPSPEDTNNDVPDGGLETSMLYIPILLLGLVGTRFLISKK